MDVMMHANNIAIEKQMHSDLHTDSCVKKNLKYCRYCERLWESERL